MKALDTIRDCIERVRTAPNQLAAGQAERRCRERLGTSTADRLAAAAARRIGQWLK